MRALALVGPRASQQQVKQFIHPEVTLTTLRSAEPEEVSRALGEQPDIVLIFGGDGTVNVHLNQLAKVGIPVLVVPCGSGNDLARVARTDSIDAAVQTWKNFRSGEKTVSAVDLGLISSPTL